MKNINFSELIFWWKLWLLFEIIWLNIWITLDKICSLVVKKWGKWLNTVRWDDSSMVPWVEKVIQGLLDELAAEIGEAGMGVDEVFDVARWSRRRLKWSSCRLGVAKNTAVVRWATRDDVRMRSLHLAKCKQNGTTLWCEWLIDVKGRVCVTRQVAFGHEQLVLCLTSA